MLSCLLSNYKKPEDLIGENALLKRLTKLPVEKFLDAEQAEHPGHERHESVANVSLVRRIGSKRWRRARLPAARALQVHSGQAQKQDGPAKR